MPAFHSVYDRCYHMTWLFSGALEDAEDDTVMEMHGADPLYSVVKSLMDAILTEAKEAQQNAAHPMIQIAKHWTVRRWWESKLANRKALGQIPMETAYLIDL